MTADFAGAGTPLSRQGFADAVAQLQSDEPTLWSLLTVETRGFGFFGDRRQKILFERHIFHKRTGGRFDASNPDISSPNSGGYVGGTGEYDRLAAAIALDRQAALESTSWGLGQVMGFNATGVGFLGAEAMVSAFMGGEDAQLQGVVQFIAGNAALADAFGSHNWKRVAFFYNGSDFAKNQYDAKLQQYHDLYELKGTPSLDVRTAQAGLLYAGFDPHGVDGTIGNGTRAAIAAFQKANGLTATAELDDATLDALTRSLGT